MLIGTSMQFPGGRQYCSSTRGWRKLFWEDKEELAGFGRKVKWEVIGKSFSATRDVTCRLQAKGHWHLHSIETAGHLKTWKCFSSPMPESWWGLLWTTKGGLFLHNRYLGSAWEWDITFIAIFLYCFLKLICAKNLLIWLGFLGQQCPVIPFLKIPPFLSLI